MLAAAVQNRCLVLSQRPEPRLLPGWALIRVHLAGICNTDVEILRGYHNFQGILGHEFVGQVVRAAGKAAPEISPGKAAVETLARKRAATISAVNDSSAAQNTSWVGRRVVGEINIACAGLGLHPVCSYCRRGIPTHCARRRVLGIVGQDGAFAEYVALPLVNLRVVPEHISDAAAVFTEPLAAACRIAEQVNLSEHREAAVLGDGKLAQLVARALQVSGVRVTMIGKHESKMKAARLAGISTLRLGSRDAQRADAFTLAVDATGSPSGLALAQRITAPQGTLVLKSTFHGAAAVETWPTVVKELTLIGSRCGPFATALRLLEPVPRSRRASEAAKPGKQNAPRGAALAAHVDPTPLISNVFPLRDAKAAIRYAQQPGVLKVLLRVY